MLARFVTPGRRTAVYGTIARMKVKAGKLDELKAVMEETENREVPGYQGTHVLIPDTFQDEILMVVFFDDRASYMKNANDPAMHEDYLRYRALLEDDPEWTDGEWVSHQP
jgi:antibiotic biosynthesis monooxygenase (ABM) superfamily enzyme